MEEPGAVARDSRPFHTCLAEAGRWQRACAKQRGVEPLTNSQDSRARIGAMAAPVGAVVLLVSTVLHPMEADPNDAAAAFAEYAADSLWVWSHLGQFAGVAILGMALVGLAATLEVGRAAGWARIALAGTAATVATAAALQSVDGVALKVMVDRWAAASDDARGLSFEAAFAVRQVEIGLAAFLNVVLGFTLAAFGAAILTSARYPAWLGAGGLLAALLMTTAGVATSFTGFSSIAMTLSMLGTLVFLVWLVVAGILMWRLAPRFGGRRTNEPGVAP